MSKIKVSEYCLECEGGGAHPIASNLATSRNVRVLVGVSKMIEDALLILFISFCTAFLSEGKSLHSI